MKRSTGGAAAELENSTKRKRTAASGTGPNNSRVVNIDLPGNVDGNLWPSTLYGYTTYCTVLSYSSYSLSLYYFKLFKSSDSYYSLSTRARTRTRSQANLQE